MKHIRLIALGTAVVLSLSLLTACGGDKSALSGSESDVSAVAPEVSMPEASAPDLSLPDVSAPAVSTPDASQPDESKADASDKSEGDKSEEEKSLSLNKSDFTLKAANASYKIRATVTGVEKAKVLWTTSDEKIVTVAEDGTVTAVAPGTATITATVEGTELTAKCVVRASFKVETAPETKPEEKPADPAPEAKPEEKPAEPAPEAPAKVDLNAFYNSIFTNPADAPAMVAMDNDMLGAFYAGLNGISLKQKVAYMPMMTAVPCEIVMVECANASDVAAVKSIFKARISSQVDNHFNYPMVIEAWEKEAKVVSHGNYVALFVVSGMTNQVVSNFNALF